MSNAIKLILDKDPKRPAQLIGKSDDEIKRERDIENIKWIMSNIHIGTLDQNINSLPKQIEANFIDFFGKGLKPALKSHHSISMIKNLKILSKNYIIIGK